MATFRTSRAVSAADAGQPHLVLVGLPGSGKSTVGALLAERLGRSFLDFDLEIARREGVGIAEIFGRRGELYFRGIERALTEELLEFGNMVLAPGGGWMTQPETVALLRPPASLVHLRVTPATAMRRMGALAEGRPLLRHPDPLGELQRLLVARRDAYGTADHVVDSETLTAEQVAQNIVAWIG